MVEIIDFVNGIIWSKALVFLCLGAGVYFSIVLRFPQVRLIKDMVLQLKGGKSSRLGVSNEAGQGTGPMAAAAAEVSHPAKHGLLRLCRYPVCLFGDGNS